MVKTIPTAYDSFAWIYNMHWGRSFLPTILPVLENMVLSKIPQKAYILDLCCGTGQLAHHLDILGYRVTGLDGSNPMLEYARENAPGAEFIKADAREFKLLPRYHAAVSAFDSLNHIMTLKELGTVFENVLQCLGPGGYFLCDLNTEAGYINEWHGDFTIVEDDHVCVVQNTYSPARRIATFEATIFRLADGFWYRSDVTMFQKCHSSARVVSALKLVGFTGVEIYGFNLEDGIQPLTKEMRRAFFLCRKPK